MYQRLRKQFSPAAMIISVFALVIALAGGAFAANSNGGSATASAKGKRGPKGPKGAPGAQGPVGPVGPQGPKGDPGAAGTNGTNGTDGKDGLDGTDGTDGKSPEVVATDPASCGAAGGVTYEAEDVPGSEADVCNGTEGPQGSPWTDGGTLPVGATETGFWAVNGSSADTEGIRVPISFGIPIPASLEAEHIHYGIAGSGGAFATGGACPTPAEKELTRPEAAPGELCVYQRTFGGTIGTEFEEFVPGLAFASGTSLRFKTPEEVGVAFGSFAVTGCETELVGGVPSCIYGS